MTTVAFGGQTNLWVPERPFSARGTNEASNDVTVANDAEEIQLIGYLMLDGYATGKTIDNSGSSAIQWLPGGSTVFNVVSTLRVGLKQASSVSGAAGPPARATVGTASFDVYKDLVAGVDAITSTTWRSDVPSTGSLNVSHGDLIAICFNLTKASGTSSVKVRGGSNSAEFPSNTLVTSAGGVFTVQNHIPNVAIVCSDGTLGWIYGSDIFSVLPAVATAPGNGNIYGNKFTLPVPVKCDGVYAAINAGATADFDLGIWTDTNPPVAVASISFDANRLKAASTFGMVMANFAPVDLSANVPYIVGFKQTTANAVSTYRKDVDNTALWAAHSVGPNCFAVVNSGGGAFAAINSGKSRAMCFASLSGFDNGAGTGAPVGQQCM